MQRAPCIEKHQRAGIWRYDRNRPPPCAAPAFRTRVGPGAHTPLEGVDPDAGRIVTALPVPLGATQAQVDLGNRIYHGQVGRGALAEVPRYAGSVDHDHRRWRATAEKTPRRHPADGRLAPVGGGPECRGRLRRGLRHPQGKWPQPAVGIRPGRAEPASGPYQATMRCRMRSTTRSSMRWPRARTRSSVTLQPSVDNVANARSLCSLEITGSRSP